jgi:hypothetical protein
MVTDTLLRVRQSESGKAEPELSTPSGKSLPTQKEEGDGITTEVQFAIAAKATPRILQLATVPDDRLRMKVPVRVNIEQEGEFYVARCNDLNEFGYGESPTEAIEDLQLVLVELYWTLKGEEEKLGTDMVEVWKHLRELIQER